MTDIPILVFTLSLTLFSALVVYAVTNWVRAEVDERRWRREHEFKDVELFRE